MNKKVWILLPLSFLIGFTAFGQENDKKTEKAEAVDSVYVIGKGRMVYKNRIYRENAPYFTMGYGVGYSFQSDSPEQNMSASFQYFFRKFGLQLGYHASSDTKIWWKSYQKANDLFVGAGKRWEGTKYNVAVFGGPSWSYGSYLVTDSTYQNFYGVGLHTEVLATYKITYDMGVGLSLNACINKHYSNVGAEIHLYFSTAFVRNNF